MFGSSNKIRFGSCKRFTNSIFWVIFNLPLNDYSFFVIIYVIYLITFPETIHFQEEQQNQMVHLYLLKDLTNTKTRIRYFIEVFFLSRLFLFTHRNYP